MTIINKRSSAMPAPKGALILRVDGQFCLIQKSTHQAEWCLLPEEMKGCSTSVVVPKPRKLDQKVLF